MLAYTYVEKGRFELLEKPSRNCSTPLFVIYDLFAQRRDGVIKIAVEP